MSDQLAFDYDPPRARTTDPETSHGAAIIAIDRAATHRQAALEALRNAGERGLTDFDLAAVTGVPQTSIGVRRKSLVDAGLVTNRMVIGPDGVLVKDKRPSSTTGSPSLVWVAIEFQRADAKEGT